MKPLDKATRMLIDEGSALNKQIKENTKRLDDIKRILKEQNLDAGIYTGPNGGGVVVAYKESWEAPAPIKLYEFMKNKKKGKLFFSCVKVIAKDTIKAIGETEYNDIRMRNEDTVSFSFK